MPSGDALDHASSEQDRAAALARMREVVDTMPEVAGSEMIELPHVTEVYVATRLG